VSLAIAHFSIGFSVTLAALTFLAVRRYKYFFASFGGVWAMAPDICQIAPISCQATHIPASAVFFGHTLLDGWDVHDAPMFAAAMVALLLLTVLVVCWRDDG